MKTIIFILIFSALALCDGLTEPTKNLLHLSISGGVTMTACLGSYVVFDSLSVVRRSIIGSSIGIMPGIAKEFLDYSRGHEFSMSDIGYDLLGVGISCAIYITINKIILEVKNGR